VSDVTVKTQGARHGLVSLEMRFHYAVAAAILAGVTAAEKSAVSTTRFKDQTGGTRHSIKGVAAGTHGFVSAGGASKFLQYGTHAALEVRTVPMMIAGSLIFRRFRHPGIQPRPFMTDARLAGEAGMRLGAEVAVSAAIRSSR